MKVFDESPKTKAEPEEHAESARDMATMTGHPCHIFHNKCNII